ncbi:cell envelope integrity protein TolA [Lactobacillus delbrueckii]|uniref:cell envelope integrity protein TolA n=1 Tax=Lactobacillus delbrueckii TaxID=1584 RepID=UPI000E59FA77|nr:cell envelope integrity protein TolA [Lactobacillus delbrueckii]RHX64670.1 hypothetical protein DSY26_08875 [Lactobacillus delbrueckii]
MAENNSIDNLSRQDLLTVLGGFIKQTEQINEIKHKYHSRYDDIAHEVVRTEYKKEPKNLVIAYFLAPFSSSTFFSWLFALLGDYALILLLFLPINFIKDLSRGAGLSNITYYTLNNLGLLLLWVLLGIIGYFMGRKNYMQDWVEKAIKKGTYNNEIDAAADSDPQIIDYKNKRTSLVSDATYQQYRSLIPQDFERYDIIGIYNMLLHYRADNFKEAVIAWFQHCAEVEAKARHDREVKEQHDREVRQAELAKRQAELQAKQQAEQQAELAKQQAELQAELQAKAIISALKSEAARNYHDDRFERQRRKNAEKRRDQAILDIADRLK